MENYRGQRSFIMFSNQQSREPNSSNQHCSRAENWSAEQRALHLQVCTSTLREPNENQLKPCIYRFAQAVQLTGENFSEDLLVGVEDQRLGLEEERLDLEEEERLVVEERRLVLKRMRWAWRSISPPWAPVGLGGRIETNWAAESDAGAGRRNQT